MNFVTLVTQQKQMLSSHFKTQKNNILGSNLQTALSARVNRNPFSGMRSERKTSSPSFFCKLRNISKQHQGIGTFWFHHVYLFSPTRTLRLFKPQGLFLFCFIFRPVFKVALHSSTLSLWGEKNTHQSGKKNSQFTSNWPNTTHLPPILHHCYRCLKPDSNKN